MTRKKYGKVKAALEFRAQLTALFQRVNAGERVWIPTIGVFDLVESAPRRILNPITGEPMMLPVTWRIRFRPSKIWKGSR